MHAGADILDHRGDKVSAENSRLLLDLARSPEYGLPVDPHSVDFEQLVRSAEHHRLLGVLADAVAARQWHLEPGMSHLLERRLVVWQTNSIRLEQLAIRTSDALERAKIPVRFLKGVVLAHLVYDSPSSRVFADLDLLVPAQHLDRAVSVLCQELGAMTAVPEVRPGFTREFGKEWMLEVGRSEVDVHRTLVGGAFGLTIDVDELFSDYTPVVIGTHTMKGLGPDGLLLHACYQAAIADYPIRLGSLHDLLLIASRVPCSVDRVRVTAGRWQGSAVVQRAASLAVDLLDLDASHALASLGALPVPRRQRWLLHSYLTPARSYTRQVAALVVIPGLRPRLRYLAAIIRPSPEYLHSRGWTEGRHLRRAFNRLTRPSDA